MNETTPQDYSVERKTPTLPFSDVTSPFCQRILYLEINYSRVRIWDLIILIPNFLFLLFLIFKSRRAVSKLQNSSSPIFTTFYILMFLVSGISVLRCAVSMTVDATTMSGDVTDKVLWLVLRFFLLATELSVVIFGLAFGHLDSRTSIQRVLFVTFLISLLYSVTQAVLELKYDHPTFIAKKGHHASSVSNSTTTNFNLFAHGGMIFLFTSSISVCSVYALIVILPFTRLRERFQLPTKRLFYYYCVLLACLNLCQAVSAMLVFLNFGHSLCALDVTTLLYFTLYIPMVYCVFLWKFFATIPTGVHFSYKQQENYVEDDQLSLPYSNSTTSSTSKHDDHSPIFSYDSTHFDVVFTPSTQTGPGSPNGGRPTMSVNAESSAYSAIN